MSSDNPLVTKRLLGYFVIAIAVFSGLVACFGFLVAWIASRDPVGSSVMAEGAGKCAIASVAMACLGIYILRSRISLRSSL
jgi:hypothetical protein